MSFRDDLLERAAKRRARIVLCEGEDARVHAAAERLERDRIAQPVLVGGAGIAPSRDPRLGRIAAYLRDTLGAGALDLVAATSAEGAPAAAARKWWLSELARRANERAAKRGIYRGNGGRH